MPAVQPFCISLLPPAHFWEGENERKHAACQNNSKACYSENQTLNIKTLSVTIHGINVIHSLKNLDDSLRMACPSRISH